MPIPILIICILNIVINLLVIIFADVKIIAHLDQNLESKLLFPLELVLPILALIAISSVPTSIRIVLLNTAISVVASVLLILDVADIPAIPFTPIEKFLRDHILSAEFSSIERIKFRLVLFIYELIAHVFCGAFLLINGMKYCEDWINVLHNAPREHNIQVPLDERARLAALAVRVPERRREQAALAA